MPRTTHDIVCTHCGRVLAKGQRRCPIDGAPTKRRPRTPTGHVLAERYRLDEVLGKGGWATVYRARDLQRGEDAALKLLAPELRKHGRSVRRFVKEAQTLFRLNHPHVVTVWDFGQAGRDVFIVMELLKGRSLAEEIFANAPLEPARAVRIAVQILEGLGAAHDRAVIHSDLKPDNVLLVDAGRDVFVKVADFGIARSLIEDGVQASGLIGTAAYMSPEQARGGEVDARSDIFALGLVLYEMLAGQQAYPSDSPLQTLQMRVQGPPPEIRLAFPDLELPDGLAAAVTKLTAHAPADRPQDAREAIRLLEPFGAGASPVAGSPRSSSSPHAHVSLKLSPPLVGRAAELATVIPLVERLGDFPHATLLTIEGPAGVGKSKLASHLAEIACAKRAARRHDRSCSQSAPLGDLSEVLEALLETRGWDATVLHQRLTEALGDKRRADDLLRFMRPAGDESPMSEGATTEETRNYHCQIVLDTFAHLATDGPLVVVLDDLHAADSLTRAAIGRVPLWSHDRGKGLMFIVTRTTEDAGPEAQPETARGRLADRARRVRLGPLSQEDSDALLKKIGLEDHRVRQLIGKLAAGNPLHAIQLIRHMKSEKLLLPTRRGWKLAPSTRADLSVPYAIGTLAARQVQQLRMREEAGQLAADLLERVALVGERAPLAVLRGLLEREGRVDLLEKMDGLVDILEKEDLVRREGDSIAFVHGLVREAISSGLAGTPQVSALHIGIAEAMLAQLEADPQVARAAALHFHRGGAAKRALPLALQAAARSRAMGDMEQAAEDYTLAARILDAQKRPSRATRLEVELGLGEAQLERGQTQLAEDHFLKALDLSDCAAAHAGLGRAAELKSSCTVARDHLLRAEQMYRAEGRMREAAEVLLVLRRTSQKLRDLERAREHCQDARTLFEEAGDAVGAARATQYLGGVEAFAGDFARGLALAETAAPVLQSSKNPLLIGQSLNVVATLHAELRHHQDAIDLNLQAKSQFERAGSLRGLTAALGSIGTAHGWLGEYQEAQRLLEATLRLSEDTDNQRYVSYSLINLGWVCRLAGKLEESTQWLRAAIAQIQRGEDPEVLSYTDVELGVTLRERGELDEAEACMRRVLDTPDIRPDLRATALEELEKIARLRREREGPADPEDPDEPQDPEDHT